MIFGSGLPCDHDTAGNTNNPKEQRVTIRRQQLSLMRFLLATSQALITAPMLWLGIVEINVANLDAYTVSDV
jgi:hypothetical protein